MFQTNPFLLIILLVGLSLLPFVAMVATSYLKIVVVMSLIRNALGIQSIPPNMVLNALAMILTFYIMAPVMGESWDIAKAEIDKSQAAASVAATSSTCQPPTTNSVLETDARGRFSSTLRSASGPRTPMNRRLSIRRASTSSYRRSACRS